MFFDDRADYSEPKTRTFGGVDRFIWHAVKTFEHAFQIAAGDAYAVVSNVYLGLSRIRRFEFDRYLGLTV